MDDAPALLSEMILQADVFCSLIEARIFDLSARAEHDELRLKISQCRGGIARLQQFYESDELAIDNAQVRAEFRQLILGLLWVVFRAGSIVDFKLFRKVVQIEAGFTYLLLAHISSRGSESV
ncbi:MAG: hypothetical protein M3Z64_08930 [Verrucomicrobiota bacterium]|nr:hypothetical protein [Verrucomicrobiota bacterium]